MIRIFIVLLLLGIGVTQYQLWAGRASWFRLKELEQTLVAQRAANDRLRLQNEAFAAELYSLENQRADGIGLLQGLPDLRRERGF